MDSRAVQKEARDNTLRNQHRPNNDLNLQTSENERGGTAVQHGISDALSVPIAKKKSNDLNIVVIWDNTFRTDMKSDKTVGEARKANVKIHFVILGDPKNKRNLQIASDLTGGKLSCTGNEFELQSILKAFNTKDVESVVRESKQN